MKPTTKNIALKRVEKTMDMLEKKENNLEIEVIQDVENDLLQENIKVKENMKSLEIAPFIVMSEKLQNVLELVSEMHTTLSDNMRREDITEIYIILEMMITLFEKYSDQTESLEVIKKLIETRITK